MHSVFGGVGGGGENECVTGERMHVFFAGLGILLAGVCVLCRFLLELPG